MVAALREREGLPPLEEPDEDGVMDDVHVFFALAFNDLMTERPMGFGSVGRIPGSAIREYAQHLGLSPVWAGVFHAVIRQVDTAVLEHYAKRDDRRRQPRPRNSRGRTSA